MDGSATRVRLQLAPRKWGRGSRALRLASWRLPWLPDRSAALAGAGEPGKAFPAKSGVIGADMKLYPVPAALGLIAATTGGLIVLHSVLPIEHVTLVYLVPVIVCAARWGLVPALTATLAAVAAADFFFYPPLYTLSIDDPRDLIDLILFSCVAVVTSELAARLRRAAEAATRRETEIRDLYAFSRQLAACTRPAEIYAAIRDYLTSSLGTRAILIAGADRLTGEADERLRLPDEVARAANDLFAAQKLDAWVITDPRSRHAWLVRPVSAQSLDFGVIAVDLGVASSGSDDAIRRRVDQILADAATTLARLDVARLIDESRNRAQTEVLRKALLGSVSHDLRTPLASIVGASTILADVPGIRQDPRSRALLQVLHEEAGRLNDDIQNLLDATRITNENIRPRVEWVELSDIVNAAIERRRARLSGHRVDVDLPRDLPLVNVEARLIEQAFGHILENAAKYSPPGSSIEIRAAAEPARVVLSVHDAGIGLTRDEMDHVWDRSFRGARHPDVAGSGLGLWISRAFVLANGGTVEAVSDGPRCGTTISIALPTGPVVIEEPEEACDA
jgi:two-component system, OmpR family, sensor histidine kinase KdpD